MFFCFYLFKSILVRDGNTSGHFWTLHEISSAWERGPVNLVHIQTWNSAECPSIHLYNLIYIPTLTFSNNQSTSKVLNGKDMFHLIPPCLHTYNISSSSSNRSAYTSSPSSSYSRQLKKVSKKIWNNMKKRRKV